MDRTHVVAHDAADGHRIDVGAADLDVFNRQVLHLAQVHADHTHAADGVVGAEGHVGDGVALPVEGAEEHAAIVAHVFKVHVADGLPVDAGKVDVVRQDEELSRIALGAAVVHGGGERQQLFGGGDLPGIVLCARTTGEDRSFGGGHGAHRQHQAKCKQHGSQLFHGIYLLYGFVCQRQMAQTPKLELTNYWPQ